MFYFCCTPLFLRYFKLVFLNSMSQPIWGLSRVCPLLAHPYLKIPRFLVSQYTSNHHPKPIFQIHLEVHLQNTLLVYMLPLSRSIPSCRCHAAHTYLFSLASFLAQTTYLLLSHDFENVIAFVRLRVYSYLYLQALILAHGRSYYSRSTL